MIAHVGAWLVASQRPIPPDLRVDIPDLEAALLTLLDQPTDQNPDRSCIMTTATTTLSAAPAAAETVPRRRRYRSTTRRLLTTELRLLARDPLTLTFVLVFPIVTMLIIGGSFGTEPDEAFPVNPSHWYVASYFTVVIGATGLIMLPVHIASYRERGVLRRFAASGFPRWSFALAQLAIGLIAIAIAGLLLLAVAAPVYGVPHVESPLRVAAGIAVGSVAFVSIGVLLGTLLPVRAGRAGDRAAALLPVVPARRRWAAAGGDVGRAAGDRGPASARPGEPGDPRALARHRQRHRCAADDRRDRRGGHRARRAAHRTVRHPSTTPTLVPMTERTARVAAPAALALFAVLGALMTDRATAAALAAAAVATAIGIVLAWRRVTGWPMIAGLAVAAGALVFLGHAAVVEPVLDGLVRRRGLGRADVADRRWPSRRARSLPLVPVVEWLMDPTEPGWGAWFVGISFTTVSTIFARRLRLAMMQLRAAQDELAERSRAEERNRIAAEVHDVIGHALTVSLLHIGGARLALDEDPQEARRSLPEAERLTRDSLEEVRATVGLMRTDRPDAPDAAARRGRSPRAGRVVPARRLRRGARSSTSTSARSERTRGLAAYRIVQEALTNATRHAPGQPVVVQVGPTQDGTTVTVRNDGPPSPAPTPGAGLRGMRERAESLGGHLTAGPTDGGWLVEAVLP